MVVAHHADTDEHPIAIDEHPTPRARLATIDDLDDRVLARAIDDGLRDGARAPLDQPRAGRSRMVVAGATAIGLSFGIGYVGVRQFTRHDAVFRPPTATDTATTESEPPPTRSGDAKAPRFTRASPDKRR